MISPSSTPQQMVVIGWEHDMFEFKPSSLQAARFDTDMQSALRESVGNVVDQVRDDLPASLVDDAE